MKDDFATRRRFACFTDGLYPPPPPGRPTFARERSAAGFASLGCRRIDERGVTRPLPFTETQALSRFE